MLNAERNRELRYVVSIDEIQPIPNYDRVEYARVNGWWVIVRKDQFKVGDPAVYIEIDAKTPETPTFEFLRKRKYAVKTLKMCGVISQGLLMSFEDFGWSKDYHKVGDFVTEELGITYYVPGDNERKAKPIDPDKIMRQRHPNVFKQKWARWMMKRNWGRGVMRVLFGHKKARKNAWPDWVKRTDEERVENLPYIVNIKRPWIATEKIDGSSTTFTLKRGKFFWQKPQFFVCSRNVVFDKPDKKCFYDTNIYFEMRSKYKIEERMRKMLENHPHWQWVTIQGETYGAGVQKRDYGLKEHNFMAFNLITDVYGRYNSIEMKHILEPMGIPCVPIVNANYILPDSVEEILEYASGESAIDGGMREGLVFRSLDGRESFKAVSRDFLLKYHG